MAKMIGTKRVWLYTGAAPEGRPREPPQEIEKCFFLFYFIQTISFFFLSHVDSFVENIA